MKFASILSFFLSAKVLAAAHNTCSYSCYASSTKLDTNLKALAAVIPGNITRYCVCRNGKVVNLFSFEKSGVEYLFKHEKGAWHKAKLTALNHEVFEVKINKSFYKDGSSIGVAPNVLRQTEAMFKEKIRFDKNLHKNDIIKLLVEHRGNNENVLMAKLIQKDKSLTAMRFLSHGHPGFYDVNGSALVEGFDRAPIKYTRISSPFKKSRKHPILGYSRPHKGVDLAAKSGTPIHATSSGEIVSLGALRGYGKTVIIKHKGNYQTLYAHMHGYAKGLHVGDHVNRGQLIGYVGMTGLATAPHCHYEFRIGHIAYDPMKVKLPVAEKLTGSRLARYKKKWNDLYKILQG